MSEDFWPVPIEKIGKALHAWQDADPAEAERRDMTDAEALEETFLEHGVQFVPVADDPTLFFVEVDGRKVGRLGSDYVGPHPSNDALGIWLIVLAWYADADPVPSIVLRTATAEELAEADARQLAMVDEILRPT